MIKQFIKGKVVIFIDAENLFYTQRTLKWRVSYESLIAYFRRECGRETKCFLFITGIEDSNKGQHKFLDMLEIIGYRTCYGDGHSCSRIRYSDSRYEIAQDDSTKSKVASRRP